MVDRMNCGQVPSTELHAAVTFTETRQDLLTYTVYSIDVHSLGNSWSVWRRYSEFVLLREKLVKRFPGVDIPKLPKKKLFNMNGEVIEERRVGLQAFLNDFLSRPALRTCEELYVFLEDYKNCGKLRRRVQLLEVQVSELLQTNHDIKEELCNVAELNQELRAELEAESAGKNRAQAELAERDGQLRILQPKAEEDDHQLKSLQEKLLSMTDSFKDRVGALDILQAKYDALQLEHAHMGEAVSSLKSSLETKENICSELSAKVKLLDYEHQRTRLSTVDAQLEIEKTTAALEAHKAENLRLRESEEKMKDDLANTQRLLQDTRSELVAKDEILKQRDLDIQNMSQAFNLIKWATSQAPPDIQSTPLMVGKPYTVSNSTPLTISQQSNVSS